MTKKMLVLVAIDDDNDIVLKDENCPIAVEIVDDIETEFQNMAVVHAYGKCLAMMLQRQILGEEGMLQKQLREMRELSSKMGVPFEEIEKSVADYEAGVRARWAGRAGQNDRDDTIIDIATGELGVS
jgi:hypothetical protein